MSDPLQDSPFAAKGLLHRAVLRTKSIVLTEIHRVDFVRVFSNAFRSPPPPPPPSATGGGGGGGEKKTAENRFQSDVRLIAVLSVLLAVSETARALVLLRKQANRYGKLRIGLLRAAGKSLETSAGEILKRVTSVISPNSAKTNDFKLYGENAAADTTDDDGVSGFPWVAARTSQGSQEGVSDECGHPCALDKAMSGLPASEKQDSNGLLHVHTGVDDGVHVGFAGLVEEDEEEGEVVEEVVLEDGDVDVDAEADDCGEESYDEDKDIRTKTPLQLIHYWKQMEKAILTSANRQPFGIPLPERTCDVTDPQAKTRQKELLRAQSVPASLETGAGTVKGQRSASISSHIAGAVGEMLVLPIEGCFLYERRPDVLDFAWREIDELEEQHIRREEEEEERASRFLEETSHHSNGSSRPLSTRRPALPPSASAHGLLRFDPAESPQSSPRLPSSPLQLLSSPRPVTEKARLLHSATPECDRDVVKLKGVPVVPLTPPPPPPPQPQPHDDTWRPPLKWEALFLLWGMCVDYRITIREVRQLLLSASPPAFLTPALTYGDGPTSFDVSSANLSLLWFLANVRLVYTAIVVHGDIQKCIDEMEELNSYMSVIYKKCIARWPAPADMPATWSIAKKRNNVWLVCAVQGSWQVLSAAYDELRSMRFRQSLSGVWLLAKYMYASSKTKYVSAVLIAALTALNSRITSAGRLVREEINQALTKANGGEGDAVGDSATTDERRTGPLSLTTLCCYELARLVLNYVLARTTSEFIALTAGLRKDTVRAELYEALAHMPLGYFDVRTFDEVESIVYSVDDLEGIDVQVNQYIFGAVNTLWFLREALADVQSGRLLLVSATTASLPHIVAFLGKRVKAWYDDLLRAGALPWLLNPSTSRMAAEEEAFNTDGVLLRGTEIIEAVHQLRPYGADTRLTHWWNVCTQYEPSHPSQVAQHNSNNQGHLRGGGGGGAHRRANAHGQLPRSDNAGRAAALMDRLSADAKESGFFLLDAVRRLLLMPYGKLIPGLGKGVLDLTDWLLPIFFNALGARWCGLSPSESFRLLDCASAMESGVTVVVEGIDLVQMLLENGYKAAMLERVLDSTCWEATSTEESRYLQNYVNTREGGLDNGGGGNSNDLRSAGVARYKTPSPSSGSTVTPGSFSPPPPPQPQPNLYHSYRPPQLLLQAAPHAPVDTRASRVYRCYWISKIHFHDIQFRYPSAPTVNAIAGGGFTATLHLLDELTTTTTNDAAAPPDSSQPQSGRPSPAPQPPSTTGRVRHRGRLVCLTGPSGSGKTTLLHLLLALYTNYAPDAPDARIEVELRRCCRRCGGGGTLNHRRRDNSINNNNNNNLLYASSEYQTTTNTSYTSHGHGPLGYTSGNATGPPSANGSNNASYASGAGVIPSPVVQQHYGKASSHLPLPPTLTVDLRQLPVDVLRCRYFSYVPQTPIVFSGATIAQNISLAGFVSIATDDILRKVEHCAALACCGPFVKSLPAGLLTRICDSSSGWSNPTGADGRAIVRLTPDQLQRMMLARALYHGGRVLLMDEPTANLEAATAAALRTLWLSLLREGTVKGIVCTTHDPELLAAADQVITLPLP